MKIYRIECNDVQQSGRSRLCVGTRARGEGVEGGTRGCIMYEFIVVVRTKIRNKVPRHSVRIKRNKEKFSPGNLSFSTKQTRHKWNASNCDFQ